VLHSVTGVFHVPLNLEDCVALLGRFPKSLEALLDGLPEAALAANEGADTWSVLDVVRHLAYVERVDWMPRVRMILEFGETRTFQPLDRVGFRETGEGLPLSRFLSDFARLRSENLAEIRSLRLGDHELSRRGRHPDFGAVTLSQLLATWVTHDLTHLHQISRVLAHRYRDAVGPWQAYLGVLHCK
jgi:hypothetical protein